MRNLPVSDQHRSAGLVSAGITLLTLIFVAMTGNMLGQTEAVTAGATHFRIGEKLSYTLSFEKMSTAGTAELFVASRGKLAGRDVVELRSRIRTVDIVNAAFLSLDETRTVYASPETGLPLYSTKTSHTGIPKEAVSNYL